MSKEEKPFFYRKEIFKFLSMDYDFENKKEYPFWKDIEELTFADGSIIIPRYRNRKISTK